MISRIVFQGKVLQGVIIVSYSLYNTAIIKTLLYTSYPDVQKQEKILLIIFIKQDSCPPCNRVKILIGEVTCSPRG